MSGQWSTHAQLDILNAPALKKQTAVCKGCKCGIAVVASGCLPDRARTNQGRALRAPRQCGDEKESNRLPCAEGSLRQVLTARTQVHKAPEKDKQTLCTLGSSAGRCDRMTHAPENTARKTGSAREADRLGTALGLRSRYILICMLVRISALCRMRGLGFREVRNMTTSTSFVFCGQA